MSNKYIIIEDEKGAFENLSIAMESHPRYQFLGTADNIKDGLSIILRHKPPLIFLDVELGEEKGFELIDKLRKFFNVLPSIIMTTAYDHYGKEAVNNGVLYFLSKPIDPEELEKALFLFENTYQESNSKFIIKSVNDVHFIDIDNVLYFEGDRNYTKIFYLDHHQMISTKTLKYFEETLPTTFIRIHKSYIINTKYIKSYTPKNRAITIGELQSKGIVLPLGDAYYVRFINSIR